MDKFKRNAFFIRLGLIFMVGLCIASFSLFPKQYAYPSSVTASSVDQSRRTTLKQRLDYLDLDNQIANRGKVKRHKFNEDQSRLSGDEILANRTSYSIDNQKNKKIETVRIILLSSFSVIYFLYSYKKMQSERAASFRLSKKPLPASSE